MTRIDLPFTGPILNAAGTLGFFPPKGLDLSELGGFITNPVSLNTRTPAGGTRFLRFSGGFLLHTGFPNPGFFRVLDANAHRWAGARLPVVVHLLVESADDAYRMVRVLEEMDGIGGIEAGIPPGASESLAAEVVRAASGELPVVARIGLDEVRRLGAVAAGAGATAVSFGPPRGSLPDHRGRLVSGRLYGRAVFPQALGILRDLVPEIPIFFSGGVQSQSQIDIVMQAGAAGVQLDMPLWRGGEISVPAGPSSARR